MSEESIQVGSVVRLKSGGPHMTVTYVSEGGTISCQWFSQLAGTCSVGDVAWGDLQSSTFPVTSLELLPQG